MIFLMRLSEQIDKIISTVCNLTVIVFYRTRSEFNAIQENFFPETGRKIGFFSTGIAALITRTSGSGLINENTGLFYVKTDPIRPILYLSRRKCCRQSDMSCCCSPKNWDKG